VPAETLSLEGTWIVQVWVCVSLAPTLYGRQIHARIALTPEGKERPRGLQSRRREYLLLLREIEPRFLGRPPHNVMSLSTFLSGLCIVWVAISC